MVHDIVPPQYFNAPESEELLEALDWLIKELIGDPVEDVLADARSAGESHDLTLYAKDYGCEPDVEAVRSKMRSVGIIDIPLIKNICESYQHGKVDVIEDKTGFCITIKFVDKYGVPPNYGRLIEQLREVIPAHYVIDVQLKYRTWRELLSYKWSDLKTKTWREVLNGK